MPHWANLKQHRGYQTVKGEIVLAHHKTAREGPAGITMAKDDLQLVCNYIHKTHLSQMNHSTHNVFVGLQGNPIKQQNKNIQWLTHSVQQTLVLESHTNESENREPHLKEKLNQFEL